MRATGRLRLGLAALVVLAVAAAAVVLVLRTTTTPKPKPGPPENAPRAIVSLGDSTISGEGADAYLPATNGKDGDWCHRSRNAEVEQTRLPGVVKRINLACSGATSADVGFEGKRHYTEGSQARKLTGLAREYRIVAIVVATGANDDPDFANTLTSCIRDWLNSTDCTAGFDKEWRARVHKMVPKVTRALTDIRTAMSRAHYSDSDYNLVLQSYAAPLGPDVAKGLDNLSGCPFRTNDLRWIRTTGIVVLDNGMRRAAQAAGARFLDLARAGIGHEACSGGRDPSSEWFNRLTVDWQDLLHQKRAQHAIQSSFHPNAKGYHQFATCLDQFLATNSPASSCVVGSDGDLHAVPIAPPP